MQRDIGSFRQVKPSLLMLLRILRVLTDKQSIGRTELAQEANIQYARLAMQLQLLEKKNLVQLTVRDGRVNVVLSESGREFASRLLSLCDWD